MLERLAKNDNIDRRIFTHSVDVNSLPLTDDSVDFILGFDIFELLPDEKLYPLLDEMLRIARVGAVSYLKITLHAYQPTLGQVQQFAPRKVRKLFEGRSCHGKRWELLLNDRRAPEHFTFQVVED